MIDYQTEIGNDFTAVLLYRRDDVRTGFQKLKKIFFDHMAAINFIEKQRIESLVNQVNIYVADCKKVEKSTERRRALHKRSLQECYDFQRAICRPGVELKSICLRILIYKHHLTTILPQKADPLYQSAMENLNEILKQATKYSGRKYTTKIK